MTAVSGPVHERRTPGLRPGLVALGAVVAVVAVAAAVTLVAREGDPTRGSGTTATEYRELAPSSRSSSPGRTP
jgi:hypothetical protein